MNKNAIVLLTVSLLLSAGAGWAAYEYLQQAPNKRQATFDTVPVVVASRDVTFGTKLSEEQLSLVQYPKKSVPRGAYSSVDSVLNKTSRVFIVEGEAILASKLSDVGGGLSVRVRPNMRAISLEINQVTGVSGFVLPGDRVDVITTVKNAGGTNVAVTKTVLQNAEVLASGTTTEEKGKRTITTQVVTLLVDPEGAEALALGLSQGEIHLVLRNPVDHDIVEDTSTDTRKLLGLSAPTKTTTTRRAPVRRAPPPKPKSEPNPEPTFTVIKDGNVSKQELPKEDKEDKPSP